MSRDFTTKPRPDQPGRCPSIDPHDTLQCTRAIHDDDQCQAGGIAWRKGSPRIESDRERADRLQEDVEEYDAILRRQGDLLTRTVNALRGNPPPLTSWSHHDIPELAAEKVAEVARIQNHLLCVGAAGLDLNAFTGFIYAFNVREKIYDLCGLEAVTKAVTGGDRDAPEIEASKIRSQPILVADLARAAAASAEKAVQAVDGQRARERAERSTGTFTGSMSRVDPSRVEPARPDPKTTRTTSGVSQRSGTTPVSSPAVQTAELRLAAREPDAAAAGLPASTRGVLLHRALRR